MWISLYVFFYGFMSNILIFTLNILYCVPAHQYYLTWNNLYLFFSGTLEGKSKKLEYDKLLNEPRLASSGLYEDGCADLMVECQVFSEGLPLALPVTTMYRSFTSRWR